MEESDGERAVGSDKVEDTEERTIRAIPMVTTLSFVRAVKDTTRGVRVTLTSYNCAEYVNCVKTTRDTNSPLERAHHDVSLLVRVL
jgi:hypothetical protein